MQRLLTVLKNGARPAEPGKFCQACISKTERSGTGRTVIDMITSEKMNMCAAEFGQPASRKCRKRRLEQCGKHCCITRHLLKQHWIIPRHLSGVDGYGETLEKELIPIREELKKLIDSAGNGRSNRQGGSPTIWSLGKPNAGKSSLLNVLSGRETCDRDGDRGNNERCLEEQIHLNGLNLNMIDTAGIRQTEDVVEKIGVEKAREYAENRQT